MTVTINGADFVIAGVVSVKTICNKKGLYGRGRHVHVLRCVERAVRDTDKLLRACLRHPYLRLRPGLAKTGFPKADALENSSRFSVESIFKVVGKAGERAMGTTVLAYPIGKTPPASWRHVWACFWPGGHFNYISSGLCHMDGRRFKQTAQAENTDSGPKVPEARSDAGTGSGRRIRESSRWLRSV